MGSIFVMPQAPTAKQQHLLDHIREWERKYACTPTQTELAKACGYRSTNAVRSHLQRLEKKGLLVRQPHKARAVFLAKSGRKKTQQVREERNEIPLLGNIAAGPLIEAIENREKSLPLSPALFQGVDLFALKVCGDSMKEAGILSGDIAIINRQPDITKFDIAAVMLDGEVTLKRVIKRVDKVVLQAANSEFKDLVIPLHEGSNLSILGKMVGLVRTEIN